MQRGGAFDVRSSYAAASSGVSDDLRDHDAFLQSEYYPTDAECQQLAEPIADFLSRCSCYDMLGTSTQVVVLDVDVALAVAFIAAQETRLHACVLWDAAARRFCGVLSSTDYMEILLHCHAHPEEARRVPQCTIREWRERRQARTGASLSARDASVVTCTTEMSLRACLQRIHAARARRIVVLAEKEAQDMSVVAVLDLRQILMYLGAVFLSMEAAGGGRLRGEMEAETAPHVLPNPETAMRVGRGVRHGGEAALDATGADVTLPLHVRNLLLAPSDGEPRNPLMDYGKDPRVGPYRAIVDVPFCYVPSLGRHRGRAISVTMEAPLLEALRLMLRHGIDAIAVVSAEQIIIDVMERGDVVRIEDQGVYNTNLTVREALRSKLSGKVCVFHAKDSLRDVFIHFVRQRVKELFLVDPDTDKLIGQLNVAEVVAFLVFGITTTSEQNSNNNNKE